VVHTDAVTSSPPDAGEPLVCSARGCRAPAQWAVRWNNPRLHPPERRKTWLACPEHRPTLEEHLQVRAFWRETVPLERRDDPPGA
jgi:hypothetical protein